MEEWHFCVICLSDLRKLKSGGDGEEDEDRLVSNYGESTKSVKFLIQYLLTTQGQTYNEVLQDILKLIGVSSCKTKVKTEEETKETNQDEAEKFPSNTIRMCGDCELAGGNLQELHQRMEELQRKIKKQVKTVNEIIIRSSGWLGGINGGEEAFENFSKKFCGGDVSSEVKQTFEILKAFQTAVTEAGHERERNPELLVRPLPEDVSEVNENSLSHLKEYSITEGLVKAEPSYEDHENDETGSLHLESFLEDYVGNYQSPLDFGGEIFSEIARKRKARRISSSSECSKLDANHINPKADNEEELSPLPCSSKTTAVNLHSNRIWRKRKYKEKPDFEKKKLKTIQSRKLKNTHHFHGREKSLKSGRWGRPLTPPIVKRVSGCFICDICGSKQRYPASFEHHLRGHEMEKIKAFQCETCNQEFTTKQFRDFHKDQHKGHHKLSCDICKGLFSLFELPDHMRTHVETIFPCSQCSHYSSSMENHLLHMDRQHWGKEFKCRICGSMFQKKQHLLHHFHEDHQAVDKIRCDAEGCSKTFWTEAALKKHKRLHTDQFICTTCCKRCTSLGGLQTHQRLHSGQRPFKCDQCPEAFNLKSGLINHMVSKHGAEKFKCETCGKEYSTTEGLYLHKKMEHNAPMARGYCCPLCNKKCVSPYRLQLHMVQHSAEKKYMCEVCGKSFQTSNTCNQHKRIHGEKKFVCPHPHCPKAFTKPGYLEMHVRTHTGEKPFSCDLCGKGFSQKGSVNIHRKKCPLLTSHGTGNKSEGNIQPL